MNYHAHVYFDLADSSLAETIRGQVTQESFMRVFPLVSRKVGPHAKPMFEIHFREEHKQQVVRWLDEHRQGLSVLVHPESGDDYRDHAPESVLWLGEALPIDFSFFDLVQKDPRQSLH